MVDLIEELREASHIQEFVAKHWAAIRYNSRLKPRELQGNLVLKEVASLVQQGKLQPNWEDLNYIFQKLPHMTYKMQELEGLLFPIT